MRPKQAVTGRVQHAMPAAPAVPSTESGWAWAGAPPKPLGLALHSPQARPASCGAAVQSNDVYLPSITAVRCEYFSAAADKCFSLGAVNLTVPTGSPLTSINTMKFEDDQFLGICQEIEAELCAAYRENPALTDEKCLYALDRTKILVKQAFGFSLSESAQLDPQLAAIARRIVAVANRHINTSGGPSLREFSSRIDKISRSVRRHAKDGSRSYFEFILGLTQKKLYIQA